VIGFTMTKDRLNKGKETLHCRPVLWGFGFGLDGLAVTMLLRVQLHHPWSFLLGGALRT
jgi:hypothetical protein